jgi:predicted ATPase
MRSLEYQMDALYSLMNPLHMQVETAIMMPAQLHKPMLKNVAMNMAAALDSIRHCSEVFQELKESEQALMGQCIDIASEGPDGEPFNPLHD